MIKIELTTDETNIILNALGERPYNEVKELVEKIKTQAVVPYLKQKNERYVGGSITIKGELAETPVARPMVVRTLSMTQKNEEDCDCAQKGNALQNALLKQDEPKNGELVGIPVVEASIVPSTPQKQII